jgi:hypothetical protein
MAYGISDDMIFNETRAALNAGQPQAIVWAAVYNKALHDFMDALACMEVVPTAGNRLPQKSSMEWMRRQLEDEWNKEFTRKKLAEMKAIRESGELDTRAVRRLEG